MVNSPGTPATRNGRLFSKQLTDEEAWDCPTPRSEAFYCLRVARANGGVAAMREVIAVSEAERAELLSWAAADPSLTGKILAAVAFRGEVLEEFEKLLAAAVPESPSGLPPMLASQ